MWDQMKQLKDLAGLMGQGSALQEKARQMHEQLAARHVEGEAGAGAVRVVVNGQMKVLDVILDPLMIRTLTGDGDDQDRDMIQTLIVAATNDALEKAQGLVREEMAAMAGGMNIPGLDKLLGNQP